MLVREPLMQLLGKACILNFSNTGIPAAGSHIQFWRLEMKTPLGFSFAERVGRVVDVVAALLFVGLMYFVATA
jgi:hypothetical protein